MIRCGDCKYFFRPTVKLADGQIAISVDREGNEIQDGNCRFYPPQMTVVPSAAVFGQIAASPLDPGVPGWTVACNVGSMFPPVKADWSCGQGVDKLDDGT
jgi:hypothetical protein